MDYSERKLVLERLDPVSAGAEALFHLAAFESLTQSSPSFPAFLASSYPAGGHLDSNPLPTFRRFHGPIRRTAVQRSPEKQKAEEAEKASGSEKLERRSPYRLSAAAR